MEELHKDKKNRVSSVAMYEHRDMNGMKRIQVDRLIKDMTLNDPGYEYKLVSLILTERRNQKGERYTISMRIILKRQLAADSAQTRTQGLNSQFVDINQDPHRRGYSPRPPIHDFPPPPPPVPRGPQHFEYGQPGRSPSPVPIPGVGFIPQPGPFPPQFTPPSSDGSDSPSDRFPMPQDTSRPGPGHPSHPEDHAPFPEPSFDRPEIFHAGPPREQAKGSKKNDGKAKAGEHGKPKAGGDSKGKAGDHSSKGNQAKREKNGHQAYSKTFESDYSEGTLSDDSGFSKAGTNRTEGTEFSDPHMETRHMNDQKDGYRSFHGSKETSKDRHHDEYDRGHRRDHTSRRRDGQRSSHTSRDYDEFPRSSIRQHRRKSPPRSSNSSTSSGSQYLYNNQVFEPFNSRRTRHHPEFVQDERPPFHSRNNSCEEGRPPRWKRSSGYNPPVQLFDERDELDSVRAQFKQEVMQDVKQELEKEEMRRKIERLMEERNRPEPMINDRERFPRGSGYTKTAYSDLPRSKRFSADLQSNRYPYGI